MKTYCTTTLSAAATIAALGMGTIVGAGAPPSVSDKAPPLSSGLSLAVDAIEQKEIFLPAGPCPITQNTDNTTIGTGTLACSPDGGVTTTENGFARAWGAGQITAVGTVCFAVQTQNGNIDHVVDVNVYSGNVAGAFSSLVLMDTVSVTIPVGSAPGHFVANMNSIALPANQGVVVEIFSPHTGGVLGYWHGSNSAGQSAPSYIRSASCGLGDFVTFASIGGPNVHLLISVNEDEGVDPEGACCTGDGPDQCTIETPDDCEALNGTWLGVNTPCANCPQPVDCEAAPPCPWDLNNDGEIEVLDLLALLDAWGPNPGHPADFNGDGEVDVLDLLKLLDNWGPCPQGDGQHGDDPFNEPEPCGTDTNGGCNMDEPAWTPISCGDSVCGTVWRDANATPQVRDTDWYELELTEDATVTWLVHAEFPASAIIINNDCDDLQILASASQSSPGVPFSVAPICLPAGKYTLFVAPMQTSGLHIECGVNNNYQATVKCVETPCPGACCFLPSQDCLELTQGECSAQGGTFVGVGSECEGLYCPLPQLPCPQPGNQINENEPCGVRQNDGCNQEPPSYGTACCDHVINGLAWAQEVDGTNTRDTDWYTLKISEETCLTIMMEYNFGGLAAAMFLLNDQCGEGLQIVALSEDLFDGRRRLRTTVQPGVYRIFAATAVFEGLPCPGGPYTLTITCDNADIPCSPTGFVCSEALPVEIDGATVVQNNAGFPPTAPACGGPPPITAGPGTVWFKVVGDGSQLTAHSCGSDPGQTLMTVYCGGCPGQFCIDGSDEDITFECGPPDGSQLHASSTWCSEVGVTYLIAVRGAGGAVGDIQLNVTSEECFEDPPFCGETNNTCAGAIDVTADIDQGPVLYDSSGASAGPGDPDVPAGSPTCHWDGQPDQIHHTLWFKFQAPASGNLTVETCTPPPGGYVDSVLAIYDGTCGSFTEIGCGEDDCGPAGTFLSQAQVTGLNPGQTYYIMVANSGGWAGWAPGEFWLELYEDDPVTGTCEGNCGGGYGDPNCYDDFSCLCFCDEDCCGFGDCCPDKFQQCGGCQP